jgi:predicted transcriptional regulator
MKISFKKISFIALQALIALSFLLGSLQSKAWISKDETKKLYNFKFKMADETYEYSQKSSSYEEAYQKAAQDCYTHFKAGQKLTEDRGLDIIDVCANPRS